MDGQLLRASPRADGEGRCRVRVQAQPGGRNVPSRGSRSTWACARPRRPLRSLCRVQSISPCSNLYVRRSFFDDIYGVIDAAMHGFGRAVVPRHRLGGAAEEALHVVADTKAMRAPVVLHHFRQPAYTRAHEAVRDAIVTGVPHLLQPTGRRRSS